jgi:hypothetical protein
MTRTAKSSRAAVAGLIATVCLTISLVSAAEAQQPYIGEVMTFAGTFCPENFLSAEGTLLPIDDGNNQALFFLLGPAFGGDGVSSFALPNLVGAADVATGQGVGRPDIALGQAGGTTATVGVQTAIAKSVEVPKTQSPSLGLARCVAQSGTFPQP